MRAARCAEPNASAVARMWADCRLADELPVATQAPLPRARTALVTGATGFLGRHVLRQLLAETTLELLCLVRGGDAQAAHRRLVAALGELGPVPEAWASRLHAVAGDLELPDLGWPAETFERLATQVDRIVHLGATVNWTRGYEQLRATNVLGCLALARLAVTGRVKPMVFVSSIAVCFARGREEPVDEGTDMTPWLDRMPLAYAQTKCVAEALLRSLAARGLPVTVLRAGLISGCSRTGQANPDDLTAALVEATARRGVAMDADWQIDFVPVDHVAAVVTRTLAAPAHARHWRVLHLLSRQPRSWREFVLWLNLNGYPVRFVEPAAWRRRMFEDADARRLRLFGYRAFFNGSVRAGVAPPFETYLGDAQRRVSQQASLAALRELQLEPAAVEAPLLALYMRHYQAAGLVGAPAAACTPLRDDAHAEQHLERALVAAAGTRLGGRWTELPLAHNHGILNGIASARLGAHVGVRRFRRAGAQDEAPCEVIVKTKPSDRVLIDLTCELAALCSPALGQAIARHSAELGLEGSHERELDFYECEEPRLRRFLPRTYATLRDARAGLWSVTMQHLVADGVPGDPLAPWGEAAIGEVVARIAQVHAIWYGRADALELPGRTLARAENPAAMMRRAGLWAELQRHAEPWFAEWGGVALTLRHRALAHAPQPWVGRLFDGTQTLIHNDFNPRNVFLRRQDLAPHEDALCIVDWELARVGLPQHDVAEFLCFAVDPAAAPARLLHWVDAHRRALAQATGTAIDPLGWQRGFAAALDHLLAERLPMYTLMHRFQPQRFLPRLVRSWLALREAVDAAVSS